MSARALVVSLHDVSPRTRPTFEKMLADLTAWGVERCSLLVIPDHHHRGHFLAEPDFCRWLERLASAGHELVVHGYYHQRPAASRESAITRWITRVYTAGEAEFFDLPAGDAESLLARAQKDFATLDAPEPRGFIAPAWLLGAEAGAAVKKAGFDYTVRLRNIEDFSHAKTFLSQSVVYSCRNAWRRTVSLGWNALLSRQLRGLTLARVSLHPPDYRHPAVWRQVRDIVRNALRDRRPMTYAGFLDSQSA